MHYAFTYQPVIVHFRTEHTHTHACPGYINQHIVGSCSEMEVIHTTGKRSNPIAYGNDVFYTLVVRGKVYVVLESTSKPKGEFTEFFTIGSRYYTIEQEYQTLRAAEQSYPPQDQ